MRVISDLSGTRQGSFRILDALLSAAGLTAQRTFGLPDQSGTLLAEEMLRQVNGQPLVGTVDLWITSVATSVLDLGMVPGSPAAAAANTAILQAALTAEKPLYFPAGRYYISFTPLILPAKTCLYGDSGSVSEIAWVETDSVTRGHMIEAAGDIDALLLRNIGFVGNRPYQTTPTSTGHDLACFYLRAGSVRNVDIEGLRLSNFGDGVATAGGGFFIGSLTGTGKVIDNIRFYRCEFVNISNVPGIYINGDLTYHSAAQNIVVDSCIFRCGVQAHQNCIYILGGGTPSSARNIQVLRNQFIIEAPIDTCVELNFCSGFAIEGNQILCRLAGECVGLLVREACTSGTVSGNVLISTVATLNGNTAAISIVRLLSSVQAYVNVIGNIIVGWAPGGAAGSGCAINVGTGSQAVNVLNNIIQGSGNTSALRCKMAIQVGGGSVSRVMIRENMIAACNYALGLALVTQLTFADNHLFRCGDGAVCVIPALSAGQALANVLIRNNVLSEVTAGTPNFVSADAISKVGNRIENNLLPANLQHCNPSFVTSWEAIVRPAASGTLLAGKVYTMGQGAISMADGQGFTIGANLDATLDGFSASEVVFGDTVIVTPPGDMLGISHSAYIQATNRIRIRVQNESGAAADAPAGNWKVVVIKTSEM